MATLPRSADTRRQTDSTWAGGSGAFVPFLPGHEVAAGGGLGTAPGGPPGRRSWGEVESLLPPASLAGIVILFIFTFEPCKACGWGRSVWATRCQRRSARRPAWPGPGEGTGRAPPAPPDPPPTVAAAPGRGAPAGHPRPAGPRGASARGPARPGLRLRLGSARMRGAGPIVVQGARAGAAPAGPRPRPPAARPTFSLSPAPSAPSLPSPPHGSPPSPRFPSSCLVMCRLFLFAVETISRRSARPGPTRRGGGEREAGRGGESGGAGGRTRGAPGGRRRSHAAPRPPRPCRPRPRPPPAACRPGLAAPRPRVLSRATKRCPLGACESLSASAEGQRRPRAPAPGSGQEPSRKWVQSCLPVRSQKAQELASRVG